MNEKERKLQEIAAKNAAKSNGKSTASNGNGNGNGSTGSTRAGAKTKAAGQNVSDKVSGASENLKGVIKAKIVADAVKGALEDISNGDFGDVGEQYFDALENATAAFLEETLEQYQQDFDPKFMLTSGESSTNGSMKSLPVIVIEAEEIAN